MKIQFSENGVLKKALAVAVKAAATKSVLPVLECVKIKTLTDDSIELTCYNLVTGITVTINEGVTVIEAGEVLVSAKLLTSLIKKSPSKGEMLLETDEGRTLKVKRPNMEFTLSTESSDTFPKMPELVNSNNFEIAFGELKDSINQTLFAAGDDTEGNLTKGCCFTLEVKDGEMKAVSLDGYRIAVRRTKIGDSAVSFTAKIPKSVLAEISKLTVSDEETVKISYDTKNIIFDVGSCRMTGRLYGGSVFNLENIKVNSENLIEVNTGEIQDAIDSLTPLVTQESKTIIVNLYEDKIVFNMTSTHGTATTQVGITSKSPIREMTIGFNINYLLDVVFAVEGETFGMLIDSATTPLKVVDGDNSEFIVLPVRIRNAA